MNTAAMMPSAWFILLLPRSCRACVSSGSDQTWRGGEDQSNAPWSRKSRPPRFLLLARRQRLQC